MQSVRALMTGMIDYAGLFPPAGLSMEEAVRTYADRAAGEWGWMLGRFVLPASRLGEFERASRGVLPGMPGDDPWAVSALIGDDPERDISAIFEFNQRHAEDTSQGLAVIDSIEIKATSAPFIDRAMKLVPEQLDPYFEIPWDVDPRGAIAALAGTGGRAKIRTGGVTADAFPPAERVAAFIAACAASDVPFKATAGLHHALRAEHALTYQPGSARCVMHGFLNVFTAAALVKGAGLSERDAAELLREASASAIGADDQWLWWRDRRIDTTRLARIRESFAMSFGSCSFDEPLQELRAMGLLRS